MKTYEIMEKIDKLGKEMLNKEYKLIDKNSNFAIDISEGEIATIREFAAGEGFLALSNEGVRVACLTGFEEWEEIKEPVNFMDVLRESNNKSIRFKLEHNLFIDHATDRKFTLSVFLNYIGHEYTSGDVADILLNGKFYIED